MRVYDRDLEHNVIKVDLDQLALHDVIWNKSPRRLAHPLNILQVQQIVNWWTLYKARGGPNLPHLQALEVPYRFFGST